MEAALASELNVSRLPIREALTHLENEGFVRILPRRSSRVMQWIAADVTELFDVRLSLETLAARLAAKAVAAAPRCSRCSTRSTQNTPRRTVRTG
ncbi:GntR family transcriptional regulator [Arthrobacter sp. M4]|uniref:GntR family transcriptional regulator n=1 Tax=Arthrobacter sp. M4 TaxID=218160 RepID=UPI0027E0DD2B|nr:GntR family transcriptional regulator [Arthrobacter sp. M4]